MDDYELIDRAVVRAMRERWYNGRTRRQTGLRGLHHAPRPRWLFHYILSFLVRRERRLGAFPVSEPFSGGGIRPFTLPSLKRRGDCHPITSRGDLDPWNWIRPGVEPADHMWEAYLNDPKVR